MVPPVTVLLPLYQHGDTIGAALASMLAQTYTDLAIHVLDDGSTDQGPQVVADVAAGDPRVRLFRFDHRGIVVTLESGLAAVRSPFVARMDADDYSAPRRLEMQMAAMAADPQLAAVDCQVELGGCQITGGGMRQYVDWVNGLLSWGSLRDALFEEAPLVHPATVLRTEALREVGGYQESAGPEDYSLWLRLVGAGWRLGKVPETLFTWADSPGRLTRVDPRCTREAQLALKVRMLPELVPGVRAGVQVWGAGPTGRRLMRQLAAAGIPIVRIYDFAKRLLGRELFGAPVVSLYDLPAHPSPICLVALGRRPAKERVREFMGHHQLKCWEHFLFVS